MADTKLDRVRKFLIHEFIYSGHLQSLGASGIVYISSFLLLKKNIWQLLIFVYFIFQFIYLNDRYRGMSRDWATNLTRTRHLKCYSNQIPYLLVTFVLVGLIGVLINSNIVLSIFSLCIVLLGYFYSSYFKKITKNIFMFKDFFVSAVFASLVFYPFTYYSEAFGANTTLIMLLSLVFVESVISQSVLDIKDLSVDKKNGLLTLPVLLGKRKALRLLRIGSLVVAVVYTVVIWCLNLNVEFMVLIIVSLLINQISLYMIYGDKKSGYAISAGKFFFWFFFVMTYKVIL